MCVSENIDIQFINSFVTVVVKEKEEIWLSPTTKASLLTEN